MKSAELISHFGREAIESFFMPAVSRPEASGSAFAGPMEVSKLREWPWTRPCRFAAPEGYNRSGPTEKKSMRQLVVYLTRLAIVGVAAFTSTAHSAGAAQPNRARPPNIVFIFSDDHAYQAISAYGDPRRLMETPNIDRLAREGMRFDRCVVPNSICGPSRASVLTGKYSHRNGFYNNTNSRFDGSQTDVSQAAPRRRVPDGHLRQMASRHRPDRLRLTGTSCRGRASTTTRR